VINRAVQRIDHHAQVRVPADLPAALPLLENGQEALPALPQEGLPVQAGKLLAADGLGQQVRDSRGSFPLVEASCQRHKIRVQVTPDVPGIFDVGQQIGFVRERLQHQGLPRGPVTVQG
jgi:hypothetical protein